ncbi:DoxX family protein [Paracoccus cavernae]|uniref:DoxX family protein n=1 Tax=Paracoccus cavernae TaxID=1571207 RepID=A0ABT8DAR3_9RHOB|nr:DoxX family protein [Paracoccus cavernae]
MAPFYHNFAQPVGWLVFRLIIGGLLMVEGWPKIIAPMAQTGFIENVLGLPLPWLFSPLLAIVEFGGGFLIAVGLLTRPAALASTILLAVTIKFHMDHPYGDALLTPEGITFLQANLQYLTAQGQQYMLTDGGAGFLAQVQGKAEFNSIFWTAGAAIIAAFGGGKLARPPDRQGVLVRPRTGRPYQPRRRPCRGGAKGVATTPMLRRMSSGRSCGSHAGRSPRYGTGQARCHSAADRAADRCRGKGAQRKSRTRTSGASSKYHREELLHIQ